MTTDAHDLVNAIFAAFTSGSSEAASAVLAPDFLVHHPAFPNGAVGVADTMGMIEGFRAGIPDLAYAVEDIVVQDDRAAVRWVATGTHEGTSMGVPATGRSVAIIGIDIFRIEADRLVEAWVCSDLFGLMSQVGAIPRQEG